MRDVVFNRGEAASAPAVQDVQDDGVWEDYEGGGGGGG